MSSTPLLELNNWLGIEKGQPWEGLSNDQPHKRFAKFTEPSYSIRAGAKILRAYWSRHGIRTIRQAIYRWAPPHENPSDAYAERVARHVGVGPDDEIVVLSRKIAVRMLYAMALVETGQRSLPRDVIERGVTMAGFAELDPMPLTEAARTDTGMGAAAVTATTVAGVAFDRVAGSGLSDEVKLVVVVALAVVAFVGVLIWRSKRD
jgi:hypothetical protein